MFDIGFTEIIIICIVGLLVIGPSRMPEAIRSCAMWMGRGKRMLSNVRRDLENEIGMDEIRQDLRNEQIMKEIKAENLEEEQLNKEKQKKEKRTNAYLDSAFQNGTQSVNKTSETTPKHENISQQPPKKPEKTPTNND